MRSDLLYCGTSLVDITPPLGTTINGGFLPHYAKEIHDPLHARSLALMKGDVTVLFIVVDCCFMTAEFVDAVKFDIERQSGIPREAIVISATHCHSAGSVADVFLASSDENYKSILSARLLEAALASLESPQPVKIAFGAVNVPEHVVCRRYKMTKGFAIVNPFGGIDEVMTNPEGFESFIEESDGLLDPQLSFLAVQSLQGKWVGMVANYALHYVGDFGSNIISADYFGMFADEVKKQLNAGDDFLPVMTNGTSGNANIWDFLNPQRYPARPFEKSRYIAIDLAKKIKDVIPGLIWDNRASLAYKYSEIAVRVRKPDEKELSKARETIDRVGLETINAGLLPKIYANEQKLLANEPDFYSAPLQAIKIGNGYIGTLPGEYFGDTGVALKDKVFPDPYFTICLSNSNAGYVPPAHEMKKGGYETWRCRSSKLEEGAENIIRNNLVKMIDQLKNEGGVIV